MAYEGPLTYEEWANEQAGKPNSLVNKLPSFKSTGTDYTSTYNYTTPTVGSLGVGQWQTPTIKMPDYSGGVPNIIMPDYSKMGSLADYTGRIGEHAKMATESGLKALGELTFKPEYELERERQESRGLVGSGVENQNIQNLLTSQQARAGEFATNIYNKAFEQQTAELQSLRALQNERDKMRIQQEFEAGMQKAGWDYDKYKMMKGQEFDAAIKRGDWEQARQIHNDDIKMDLEDLRQRNEQFRETNKLEIAKFKDDAAYREWDTEYKNRQLSLDAYEVETGIGMDAERLALEEEKAAYDEGALAGYKEGDLINFVNEKLGMAQGEQTLTPEEIEARKDKEALERRTQGVDRNELMSSPIDTEISGEQLMAAGANIQDYSPGGNIRQANTKLKVAYLGNSKWMSKDGVTWRKVA